MRPHLFVILCCICLLPCLARQTFTPAVTPPDSAARSKRYLISGLPVIFYTPETRFAFGGTALSIFNFRRDSVGAQKSSLSLGVLYTQNKQMLLNLPFNLFLRNRAYHLYGEVAYNRFFYNFYGVGNDQPPGFVERYGIEFPRVRLTALKKLRPHVYAGLRYAFDKFSLFDLQPSGQLIGGQIPGSKGGVVSGLGLVALYDSRDYIFYPSRGAWAELVVYHDNPLTGSSFRYTRVTLDMCKYLHYGANILALNAYVLYSDADLPFFQMGLLGGQKKMRGFYEGRFRDNNALIFQAEYRRHLFWLLGVTVFANTGQVAARYDEFRAKHWRYTYGAGIRLMLDPAQKANLRIDFAIGDKKLLPYITIFEAF